MLKMNFKIRTGFYYIAFMLVMAVLIGFTHSKQEEKRVGKIRIEIDREGNNYFVEEEDIMDLMTQNGKDLIVDKKYSFFKIKELEKRIKSFKFVSNAQVSRDLKGNLNVYVKQRKPIARILYSTGDHVYIADDGTTLSTNGKFTSRVLIISGENADKYASSLFLRKTEEGKNFFQLLKKIVENKFWKTQITELNVNRYDEISMLPQLGKHEILFGQAEDIDDKFIRLGLFYKKIIPSKGWNAYTSVNLKFKNQIICE